MSYSVYCIADFGKAQTGLTVHGKLQDMTGALVGSAITSGIVESSVAPGQYLYTLSIADGFSGFFVMYNSADDKLRRTVGISPRETENADVKTSTRGTSTLTTADIDARLAAYDAPTKAELDTAQSAIIAAIPTASEIDTELSDNHGDGSWEDTGAGLTAAQVWSYATRTLTALGSAAGVEFTYTVTDSATTNPIADVSVWFSTNSGITNVVWYGSTDAFGVARDANGNKPRLDAGTYYILCRKTGFSFTVDTETVS